MSAAKLLVGFIVGLLACLIILALISIRAPITIENAQGDLVVRTAQADTAVNSVDKNGEQNKNIIVEVENVVPDAQTPSISEPNAAETESGETDVAEISPEPEEAPVAQEEAVVKEHVAEIAPEPDAVETEQAGQSIARLQSGQSSLLTERRANQNRLLLNSDQTDPATTPADRNLRGCRRSKCICGQ